MKNILILNGHPDKESFCFAIAEKYKIGANRATANVKLVHLIDLKFNPILPDGYKKISQLEPDLVQMQNDILWANHLVFVYPNWWATMPALLIGFIERVFAPGFTCKNDEKLPFWCKILKGKTARLIVTMDAPWWHYWLINRNSGHNAMKIGLLDFWGVRPVKTKVFSPMKTSDGITRKKWLEEAELLGEQQK